jgi:TRAP-type mannitol/chloroaromatic compound transport system permease small subunit
MNTIDRITKLIDQISIWSGKIVAWLIFPMFMVLVWEVIIRKVYRPTIWANDIATISYGTHFLLAAAFALYLQKHIRTDFVYQHLPLRVQMGLDIAQYLLFFLPGMVMFFWLSWEYAADSWYFKESLDTTWRPPVGFLYKTVIPVSAALLLIQGVSEVLKCFKTLRTGVDYRDRGFPSEPT